MGGAAAPTPPGLVEALAAYPGFDQDAEALSATPIGSGLLHQSFAVTTSSGEYVAQCVNDVFSSAIHDNIAAVSEHLRGRGCASVTLRRAADGALFVDVGPDDRWRLMDRLPGVTFETCEEPEQARSAGAAVGLFHSSLADFDRPLAPLGFAFHDTLHHLEALRAAVAECSDHPHAGDVAALAADVFAAAEDCRPPANLPLRVVHGDLKFSNVLFAGTEATARRQATALIDLDTVSRLPIYFDMGDAFRSWSNRRAEDVPEAQLDVAIYVAAAEGYLSTLALPLGDHERASLERGLENVALELCARFATDVLRECYFAWDESRFASAAEHNWARARGQWSLYGQARETATERVRALRG